ncbi:MAG: hypothetical protein FK733_07325 [Asgard group archaeon]|nr:hypothetical protein [Asgard group archaeon]
MKVIGMKKVYFFLIISMVVLYVNVGFGLDISKSMKNPTTKYQEQIMEKVYDFCIQDDLLFASLSIEEEIRIYNKSNPMAIELINTIDCGYVTVLETIGDLLLVGHHYTSDITIMNVSNPLDPQTVGIWDSEHDYQMDDLIIHENYILMSGIADSVIIINISNPSLPTTIATYYGEVSITLAFLRVYGNLLFRFRTGDAFEVISIEEIDNPEYITQISDFEMFRPKTMDMIVKNNYLIQVTGPGKFRVFDLENVYSPELVALGDYDVEKRRAVTQDENILYVSNMYDIYLMNITDPLNILTYGIIEDTGHIDKMVTDGDYLYCRYNLIDTGRLVVIPVEDAIDYEVIETTPPTSSPPGTSISLDPTIELRMSGIIGGTLIITSMIVIIQRLVRKRKK